MPKSKLKAGGPGKQPKHFLDQTAVRQLAESIAGVQEQKSQIKVEKHQHAQAGQPRPDRTSGRVSESKVKLKQTKALLSAKLSEAKRAKSKRRKLLKQSASTAPAEVTPAALTKKKVSFA
ncbi:hypothetical protein C8J57DRAFT_338771 [Mycena rebaudengoi]|nr:hypothetical protein C8J57DRAFT_338771 [Mycena rebaudengoi]